MALTWRQGLMESQGARVANSPTSEHFRFGSPEGRPNRQFQAHNNLACGRVCWCCRAGRNRSIVPAGWKRVDEHIPIHSN